MLRVLIPSCNDDLLHGCFESMERMEPGSVAAVIVGDNGLSANFPERWPEAVYVPVAEPFVYSAAINACAQADSGAEAFLIMGDDTALLDEGWLASCEVLLATWPEEYGLLNLAEESTAEIYGRIPSPDTPIEASTSLAFVGTLIPRRVWNEIGPLDERFIGYGYDDSDYCIRLLHAGYKLGITGAAMIRHQGSACYQRRFGDRLQKDYHAVNYRLFREKWGIDPREGLLPADPHFRREECLCASIGA